MDIRFDGKRALVTGAGKGIGRGITIKLAELGAEVIAVSRTAADLDELSKISPNIRTICLDVGYWTETKIALQDVGDLDILVNNAGVIDPYSINNSAETDIDRCFNVNFKSYMNIGMMIANQMKKKGEGGSIVNVSSISSSGGSLLCGIYSTTKAAVDQLTRCMALQLGPNKIRVNAVNPTYVHTTLLGEFFDHPTERTKQIMEKTPLRRFCEVEDVVYPILFLLSEKASMITGVTLPIDGGLSSCF